MALPRSRIHGISAAKRERFNGLPALGVPYRSQSLKVTEQEQEQSWLFGAGPGCSPRTYEGRDQRHKAASARLQALVAARMRHGTTPFGLRGMQ